MAAFPRHNNGTIITLPPVPLAGAVGASGQLVLGIGTASNNALGAAKRFPIENHRIDEYSTEVSPGFKVEYKSATYVAFIDSGSNGLFLPDGTIPRCALSTSFYCPIGNQTVSLANIGADTLTDAITATIVPADSVDGDFAALLGLAGGTLIGGVMYGLPFFYGRRVFTAI